MSLRAPRRVMRLLAWTVGYGALLVSLSASACGDDLDAALGRALFKRQWVPAPSSTDASDGLGPLFDARSCEACHRGAGASRMSSQSGKLDLEGAVVRLGNASGASDAYYGAQLQTKAVNGLAAEGTAVHVPRLRYKLAGPPLAAGTRAGVRQAPSLYGRAAFADIPESEILKREDPDDRDHDGISGRANRLGPQGNVGRFDWKAGRATLEDQIARAFSLDLGMSSAREPHPYGDCTDLQHDCLAAPNGESPVTDGHEVAGRTIDLIAAYLRSLPPPQPPADAKGARLFAEAGCDECHVPTLRDRSGDDRPAFTDLLLHDMGPDLDDGIGESDAASSEWRTAPLLGRKGAKGARYLHDGSAATIAQAIGKHGGEGAGARAAFAKLSPADRLALVNYVGRL